MKKIFKGNLAMGTAKVFSGLNENALRYLLPTWMAPVTGVMLRVGFGAVIFWLLGIGMKRHRTPSTIRQRMMLFALGFIFMFGYMILLLNGLSYTTPISSAIFISTEPVWVFLVCVMFYGERFTWMKTFGIILGLGGALLCILTQKQSDVASNPLLGNILCAGSSITYALYLVFSGRFLRTLDNITVTKWSFLGASVPAIATVLICGWHAPVLAQGLFSTPMLVLLFVLIFPTCISYFLTDIGLKCLSTTVVALYGNVILIVAAIVSYILGQDHFSWFQIIAMLMIAASVYYVEIAESKTSATTK